MTANVRDDILAKRMFCLGFAFLPWLWVVNILYFGRHVYGERFPFYDNDTEEDQLNNGDGGGILENMMDDGDDGACSHVSIGYFFVALCQLRD